MTYDIEKLKEEAKRRLTPERYTHSLGVMESMKKLAAHYGEDVGTAAAAGILHDITKNYTRDENLAAAEKYGVELGESELCNESLLHAATAPAVIKNELGISDEKLLKAVRYHTTGKPDMTMLEKMLFTADFIEPSRDYSDVGFYRRTAFEDIDKAIFLALRWTIYDKTKKKLYLHINTVLAYNFYIANYDVKNYRHEKEK